MKPASSICFLIFVCSTAMMGNVVLPFNQSAQFEGGEEALSNFIQDRLAYPECARDLRIEGDVEIIFFVLMDGTIYRPRVIKGIMQECDEVALNIIKAMPNWIPAQKNGKAIASRNTITIQFKLEK